jgi:hypothetical protein
VDLGRLGSRSAQVVQEVAELLDGAPALGASIEVPGHPLPVRRSQLVPEVRDQLGLGVLRPHLNASRRSF